MRILLVEDHADTRRVQQLSLRRAGHVVHAVSDGPTALTRVIDAVAVFDLLLIDIRLTDEMDGYALLSKLRAVGCQSPAIAVTAHAFPADVARCQEAGFICHVAKPIECGALIGIVNGVVATRYETPSGSALSAPLATPHQKVDQGHAVAG